MDRQTSGIVEHASFDILVLTHNCLVELDQPWLPMIIDNYHSTNHLCPLAFLTPLDALLSCHLA